MERLSALARSWWVRLGVTAGLLAVVAFGIDWSVAADRVSSGYWGWFVAAVGLLVLAFVVGAERWHRFLVAADLHAGRSAVLRAYFIGIFSNAFLPSGFGGDAARAWIIGRQQSAKLRALMSVLADRATSLACGFVLAWIAILVAPHTVPRELIILLGVGSAAGLLGVAVLAIALRGGGHGRLAARLPRRLQGWGRESSVTLLRFASDRGLAISTLALGLVFQVLGTGAFWFLAKVIGVHVAYSVMAVSVPLVLVLTALPISVAGFGVREGGFVVLLGKAGVSQTDATIVSLLSVVAVAAASLPGAVALLRPGRGVDRGGQVGSVGRVDGANE